MTLNLPSRLSISVPFRQLALACLLLLLAPAAFAQHGGTMHGGSPGGMADSHDDSRDSSSQQPIAQPRTQDRGLQLGLGGRWWDDHKTIKKLKLNPDQQHRMDAIFEADKPTLISLYINLQREQTRLSTLSPTDLQDEGKVFAAIDRVSQARADLEKENAHMLLQIRQQLGPGQLQTLNQEIASLN